MDLFNSRPPCTWAHNFLALKPTCCWQGEQTVGFRLGKLIVSHFCSVIITVVFQATYLPSHPLELVFRLGRDAVVTHEYHALVGHQTRDLAIN